MHIPMERKVKIAKAGRDEHEQGKGVERKKALSMADRSPVFAFFVVLP